MQRIIQWTLYLLVILIPLSFTTITSELFEFPKFILLLSATLVIAVAWTFDLYRNKNVHATLTRLRSPMSYAILAILATQTLATLFSIHPYTSFWGYYSRFHGGLLTTICYTIIYFAALRWLDSKSTQKLIQISVKTAIFISLIAILEHYNVSLTCMLMTAIEHIKNNVNPFITTTACWGANTNPLSRSFATLGQPNWLAAYLIPHIFLTAYLYKTSQKKHTLLFGFVTVCLFVALLCTKSRSGFLAFGLSYLTYWLITLRTHSFTKIKSSILRVSLFALLISLLFGTPYSPSLASLIKPQPSPATITPSGTSLETGGTESLDIRKIVWSGALTLIKKHPVLGTGPETFAYTYYAERPLAHNLTSEWDFLYNKAHNEYLNTAATSGLLGLAAYLFWHVVILRSSLIQIAKSKKVAQVGDDRLRALYPVLGASLVGFAVTNFFGFSVIPVYLLMTLMAVFPTTLSQEASQSQPLNPNHYLIISLASLLLLIWPLQLFYADFLYARGKALLDANQPGSAFPVLERAVRYRPDEDLYVSGLSEASAFLATAYAQSDDTVEQTKALQYVVLAEELTEKTRKHNPWHLNYFKSRAKVYLTLATLDPKYMQQAQTELEAARVLAPTDPKLAYNLGLVYTRLGHFDQAADLLREAIKLKPNYPDPYYALTLLYEQTKQADKIANLLTEAKSHFATYSAQLKEKIDKYASQ